jgi:hypothetical protein
MSIRLEAAIELARSIIDGLEGGVVLAILVAAVLWIAFL